MKIHEVLEKRAIKIGIEATDKEGALKELVGVLSGIRNIGDQKAIVKALIERENLGSTGIGQGIAIPHGKTDRVTELVAVMGISHRGVNFDALDGEPVYVFFLLVTPKEASGPHLKALAQISRLLRDSYFCELIRKCKTAEEVHELIKNEEEKKH
ncbi:MAG: PTS sugar transporter subunit IIA [Candidatus Omnitrophica bacterium]|nr:PTS sugar transporter subunit IIA [Candidatus Omnitrophota bacterium]